MEQCPGAQFYGKCTRSAPGVHPVSAQNKSLSLDTELMKQCLFYGSTRPHFFSFFNQNISAIFRPISKRFPPLYTE